MEEPKKSWLSRNWKWVVPLGCLIPIIAIGGFISVIFLGVSSLMRSSVPYQQGLEEATTDPEVVEQLGEPIEAGWFTQGSISTNNASGEADLAVPLNGPEGEGTLYIVAEKQAGQWQYQRLEVAVSDSEERIDLLVPAEGE